MKAKRKLVYMTKQKENYFRFSQTLNATSGEFANILKNRIILYKFKKNLSHLTNQINLAEFQNEITSSSLVGKNHSDSQTIYFKDLLNENIQAILHTNNKMYEPLNINEFLIKKTEERKKEMKVFKESDLIKNKLIFDDENLLNNVSQFLEEKFEVENEPSF